MLAREARGGNQESNNRGRLVCSFSGNARHSGAAKPMLMPRERLLKLDCAYVHFALDTVSTTSFLVHTPHPPYTMSEADAPAQPPAINYVVGFLLVGLAWGLTTPFIRRAARDHHPPPRPTLERPDIRSSWVKSRLARAFFAVVDLLRNPRYAVPLLINLTGSVWFFLLIGQAGSWRPVFRRR